MRIVYINVSKGVYVVYGIKESVSKSKRNLMCADYTPIAGQLTL